MSSGSAPQHHSTNPLMKPFAVLALPGVYLYYKYNQFKQKRQESARKRVTERELQHLHLKIENLLMRLEDSQQEPSTSPEDECVICTQAKATMQTLPCGHRVVCRKCFVKTIQAAVCQRILPLRCVICREKILKLSSCSNLGLLSNSVSEYSFTSISSTVSSSCSTSSLPSNLHNQSDLVNLAGTNRKKRTLQYTKGHDYNISLPPIKEITPYNSPLILPKSQQKFRVSQKLANQLDVVPLRKTLFNPGKGVVAYKHFINEDEDHKVYHDHND